MLVCDRALCLFSMSYESVKFTSHKQFSVSLTTLTILMLNTQCS